MSAKLSDQNKIRMCLCGLKMRCTDTRASGSGIRRNYKCSCGRHKRTVEIEYDGKSGSGNGSFVETHKKEHIKAVNEAKQSVRNMCSLLIKQLESL